MKILLGWFGHEANTFSRVKCSYEAFISQGSWEGQEILDVFRGTPSYIGGMIKRAEEDNIELIPSFAVENAAPTLSDECLNTICDKITHYVKKHLGEYQGVAFGLHGAGVSESCGDIETYTLRKIREIIGEEMPIVSTLDLHGNITQEMADNAYLFGIKENPHTDYATSGYEAMDTLIRTIKGEIKPVTDVELLPMLVPVIATESYREVTEYIKNYKKEHNLLDACFFPGFPYVDVKGACASIFVTSNGGAREHAKALAQYVWSKREMIVDTSADDAEQAVAKAKQWLAENETGICLINEYSDNPGGGAPGDGTGLISVLFKENIPDSAFAYMFDPEVAKQAAEAGVGAKITIDLGGKIEDAKYHGEPLHLEDVEVRCISNGNYLATTPLMKDIPLSYGLTVGLRYKNVDFTVASVTNQSYDDRPFFLGNIDFKQKRLIMLKSMQHFRAFFTPLVDKIITANPSGLTTQNIKFFDYKNLTRPIYPLDDNVDYK